MNAIDLLKQHHQNVRDALEELAEADSIDPAELRLVADELVAHMVIEEHVFYPRIRELMSEQVEEAFEEHAVARFELARCLISRGDEQKARLKVLKELILHHVREEESEVLPKVQRQVKRDELEQLGARMEPMFDKAVELGFEKLVVSNGRGQELRPMPSSISGGARRGPAQARATGSRARGGRAGSRAPGAMKAPGR